MNSILTRLRCWFGHDYGDRVIDGYILRSTCRRCGETREVPCDPTLGRVRPYDVAPEHWPENAGIFSED